MECLKVARATSTAATPQVIGESLAVIGAEQGNGSGAVMWKLPFGQPWRMWHDTNHWFLGGEPSNHVANSMNATAEILLYLGCITCKLLG